ncbi:MAG: hypothetical protein ACRDQZ_24020, partial [Mycobacteriales bacterium]
MAEVRGVVDSEALIGEIPLLLQDRAFVTDAVLDMIRRAAPKSTPDRVRDPLDTFITREYLRTNLRDLGGVAIRGLPVVYDDILPPDLPHLAAGRWLRMFRWLGLDE